MNVVVDVVMDAKVEGSIRSKNVSDEVTGQLTSIDLELKEVTE